MTSRLDFDSAPLPGVRCIAIFLPVESVSVASRHCAGAGPAPINTARMAVATRKVISPIMYLFSQINVPLAIVPAEPICHRAATSHAAAEALSRLG